MLAPTGESSGVDVVLNPNARGLRDERGLRATLRDVAARAGARVHETPDLAALGDAARAIAARGADAVVLVGGDGSFMRGLSALAEAFGERDLPPVALAPAGTVGTVARNLGLRSPLALTLAACSGEAQVTTSPTLRVRDEGGRSRIAFVFGAGLAAQFFGVYYRSTSPGLGTAAGIAARVFAGSFVGSALAREVLGFATCALRIDGERHPAPSWSLVVASVVRDLGLHFRVTYRAGERSDRFHVVASGLPPGRLGPQMPRVIAGRPLRGEPQVDALARSLAVDFADGPGPYVLDGDVLRARSIVVEAGPVLRLLRP
jgi:diacylglycerol kinase (ATP)